MQSEYNAPPRRKLLGFAAPPFSKYAGICSPCRLANLQKRYFLRSEIFAELPINNRKKRAAGRFGNCGNKTDASFLQKSRPFDCIV